MPCIHSRWGHVWVSNQQSSGRIIPLILGGDAQKYPQAAPIAMQRLGQNDMGMTFGVRVNLGVHLVSSIGKSHSVGIG